MSKFTVPKFYLKAMRSYTNTTIAEDAELIKRHRSGDKEATTRLTNNCLGMVIKFTRQFCASADPDDLLCAGNEAIVQALRLYNPKHKIKFMSYAKLWIKAYIMRESKRGACMVSRGRSKEIVRHLSLNAKATSPTEAGSEEDGIEFIELLQSTSEPADVTAERSELARAVNKTVSWLTKDNRLTLMHRFMSDKELTLDMVGKKEILGRKMKRERVRLIQLKAIDQFKLIHTRYHPDYAEAT